MLGDAQHVVGVAAEEALDVALDVIHHAHARHEVDHLFRARRQFTLALDAPRISAHLPLRRVQDVAVAVVPAVSLLITITINITTMLTSSTTYSSAIHPPPSAIPCPPSSNISQQKNKTTSLPTCTCSSSRCSTGSECSASTLLSNGTSWSCSFLTIGGWIAA
eukprot:1285657-Rhodomonas_salina.7